MYCVMFCFNVVLIFHASIFYPVFFIVRWPWVTWKAPPNEMYYYYYDLVACLFAPPYPSSSFSSTLSSSSSPLFSASPYSSSTTFSSPSSSSWKGEMEFEHDCLLEGGNLNNSTGYREVRDYRSDNHHVRFYFLTRIFSEYVESILEDIRCGLKPDLVVVNSCIWDISRWTPCFVAVLRHAYTHMETCTGRETSNPRVENILKHTKKLRKTSQWKCLVN